MHLLNGGAKVDVGITYRSGLHLEIFIKTEQDVSSIVVDDQNVIHVKYHVCIIAHAVGRANFRLHP